jgi:hypothetical protein
MYKSILLSSLLLVSLSVYAEEEPLCQDAQTVENIMLEIDEHEIAATICQLDDEIILLSDRPVKKDHLVYAGLNVGLPYMGYHLMYAQNRNGKPFLHVTTAVDSSLGGSSFRIETGRHNFSNSLFSGGTLRLYQGLHEERAMMIGPTIGIAGTRSRVAGHVSLSYLAIYNSKIDGMQHGPEFSMGVRLRLNKPK